MNNLFNSKKELLLFFIVAFTIFGLNLSYEFYKFKDFKTLKFRYVDAVVEQSYLKTKNDKTYRVLKLKNGDFSFYTTTKKENELKRYDNIKLGVITDKITFKEYIKKSFYLKSFNIKKLQNSPNFKNNLINFISNQHKNDKIKELYSTLYLATPISKELRNDVTKWGIAHVVSISGFHLGIIFTTIFLLITPIYRFFQNRFFPYRSRYFDISLVAFLLMVFYLFLLDFTPAFLRSLLMSALAFLFLVKNLKIFSFWTLFLTIIISICFMPNLVFSVGFYFSCLGVFYIYLYLHHFKNLFKSTKIGILKHILVFNIYVFFAMNIPVYYYFNTFTFSQIAVIPIGYIFTIFYPLSLFLHIFGAGNLMDELLLNFLNYNIKTYEIFIPPMLFYSLNLLNFVAIKNRLVAILLPIFGIIPIFFI